MANYVLLCYLLIKESCKAEISWVVTTDSVSAELKDKILGEKPGMGNTIVLGWVFITFRIY